MLKIIIREYATGEKTKIFSTLSRNFAYVKFLVHNASINKNCGISILIYNTSSLAYNDSFTYKNDSPEDDSSEDNNSIPHLSTQMLYQCNIMLQNIKNREK